MPERSTATGQVEPTMTSDPEPSRVRDALPIRAGETLEPGTVIATFRVLRLLGRGGSGEVYLARDVRLGRKIALKLVRSELLGSRALVDRLLDEARITARFSHPNIVTVYAAGMYRGHAWLALEHVTGQTLRQRLEAAPVSVKEALRIGHSIVTAVIEAHRLGVLHRDLTPRNVMITATGQVRVLDFGIASSALPPAPGEATPSGSDFRGTPRYMAPEQWLGDPLTTAVDVWAIGLLLHELVTARHPWGHVPTGELRSFYQAPPPDLRLGADFPAPLERLVRSCLERDPAARPSASAVAKELSSLLQHTATRPSDQSPFRGLLPCRGADASWFFGRDAEIGGLMARLRDQPLIAVVGSSGVGKSSLVRAGVIPRLRDEGRWVVVHLRPGRRPLRALAARLFAEPSMRPRQQSDMTPGDPGSAREEAPPDDVTAPDEEAVAAALLEQPSRLALHVEAIAERERARVLIFVDQLEELCTHETEGGDPVRRAFVEALCSAADDARGVARVIFTLRDDFLGPIAAMSPAADPLGRVVVLTPPDERALTEILEQTVAAAGYTFEDPVLPAQIAASVAGEQAALPLLQVTGEVLWAKRDKANRHLTSAAFAELGGVSGALARHADAVLAGLSSEQVTLAQKILLRLVGSAPGGRSHRRVTPRRDLLAGLAGGAAVLDKLVAGRLVVPRRGEEEEAELELVHESLITSWRRLARWVSQSQDDLVFLDTITVAADRWKQLGRPPNQLWTGDELADGLRRRRAGAAFPDTVRRFLDAGEHARRRSARRRRWTLAIALTVLAAVAIGFALLAAAAREQRDQARADKARAVQKTAEALREGARGALVRDEVLEARAKLRSAAELEDAIQIRALWHRLVTEPLQWQRDIGYAIGSVAFSPDSSALAACTASGTIALIDAATGRRRPIPAAHTFDCSYLAWSPSGAHLASGGSDQLVQLWTPESLERVQRWGPLGDHVADVAFVDERTIAAVTRSGDVFELTVGMPEPHRVMTSHPLSSRVLATHERWVAVTVAEYIQLYDRQQGEVRYVVDRRFDIRNLRFSTSGDVLTASHRNGAMVSWDPNNGVLLERPDSQLGSVSRSDFGGADAQQVALAPRGGDGAIYLWDLSSSEPPRLVVKHHRRITDLAFDQSGTSLATVSDDAVLRRWNVTTPPPAQGARGHESQVYRLAFSPDGRFLATGGGSGKTRILDVATGREVRVLEGDPQPAHVLAFQPGTGHLLIGGVSGRLTLWDLVTGTRVAVLQRNDLPIRDAVFLTSNDLVALNTKALMRWDLAADRIREYAPTPYQTVVGGFDGARVALGARAGVVDIMDLDVRAEMDQSDLSATPRVRDPAWFQRIAPVGSIARTHLDPRAPRIVTGGHDGRVQIVDLNTGEVDLVWEDRDVMIRSVAFHPVRDLVGFGHLMEHDARLVDLKTRAETRLVGHAGHVAAMAFSPDGAAVATGSRDGTARLWDVASGRPLWHAAGILGGTPELLSHRGWEPLADDARPRPDAVPAWRGALASGARSFTQSPDGQRICVVTFGGHLDLWDLGRDERLLHLALPELRDALPLGGGCVALAGPDGQVTLFSSDRDEERRSLGAGASAIGVARDELLVADAEGVALYRGLDLSARRVEVAPGATTVARVGPWLATSYDTGVLELHPLPGESPGPHRDLEDLPPAPAVAVVAGPMGSIIAGFAEGTLGMWDITSGERLVRGHLDGAVRHLRTVGERLFVATDLGDYDVIDLGAFHLSRCDLLHAIWDAVPVVWADGQAEVARPPPDHACSR